MVFQAKVAWNDKVHEIKLTGTKAAKTWIKLETESAYPSIDNILIKVVKTKEAKKHTFEAVAKQNEEEIKFLGLLDNGKVKEGLLVLETPWKCIEHVSTGFLFTLGRDIQLDTHLSLNKEPLATANVTGHILPNDVKLDVSVMKSDLGEATGGIAFQKSKRGISSSVQMKYGDNSFNISGEYKSQPLEANMKLDLTTGIIMVNSAFEVFNGYGVLDIKSHLDIDNARLAELHCNSWFESITEHQFNTKLYVDSYEVTLRANNDRGLSSGYEATFIRNQTLLSSVKLSTAHEFSSQGQNHGVEGIIIHDNKRTSLKIGHKSNSTDYLSELQIQSKQNVVAMTHHTKWTRDFTDLSQQISSTINVKTPYEYLRKSSIHMKIHAQPSASKVGGLAKLTFNEKSISVKAEAEAKMGNLQKDINLFADLDGFFGKASLEGRFKMKHGEGFSAVTSLIDSRGQKYDLNIRHENTESAKELYVEVKAASEQVVELETKLNMMDEIKTQASGFLTFQNDLLFSINGDLAMKSCHDVSMRGKVDLPIFIEDSVTLDFFALFKMESNKLTTNLTIQDYFGLAFDSQWTDNEITSAIGLKTPTGQHYKASIRAFGKDTHKEVSLSGSKNDNSWTASGKVDNTEDKLTAVANIECPSHKKEIKIIYDKVANSWEAEYQQDQIQLQLKGHFDCSVKDLCSFSTEIQQNVLVALSQIKFAGKFDASKTSKTTLEFSASSNGDQIVDLVGSMTDATGQLDLSVDLPNLEKSKVTGAYKIYDGLANAFILINGERMVDLSLENADETTTFVLTTPFDSIKSIRVWKNQKDTQNLQKIHFEIDVNDNRFATFDGQFDHQNRFWQMRLTTGMEKLKNVELAFHLDSLTDVHLAASYNDQFEVRILGKLEQNAANYTTRFVSQTLGTTYLANFEYDFTQSEQRHFEIAIQANEKRSAFEGSVKTNQAFLKLNSWIIGEPKELEATWDMSYERVHIEIRDGSTQLFSSLLKRSKTDSNDPYAGKAKLITEAIFLPNTIEMEAVYDVGNDKKDSAILLTYGQHFVSLSMIYTMSEDKFNGEILWKSSFEGYEVASLNARYNIDVEPTAYVSIERNGKTDFVKTVLSFDNVIPTIQIFTSFDGFEKMTLKGNYKAPSTYHRQVDLVLARNNDNLLVFAVSTKINDNGSDGEIILDLLTPIPNWETLGLEAGWKGEHDPYAIKFKLLRRETILSLKGQLSIRQGEFSVTLDTPFENYETMSLSGKLGTTSLGQHMGVSFENNAVRRDVSFAYDFDNENRALVQIKTPLQKYKSIKVRSMMMADVGSTMDFAFESQGEQNDLAFGLKYDFSQGISDGTLLAKVKAEPMVDVEAKLEYHNVDGITSNGFDGMFYFKKDGDLLASAKINRTPGHTTAQVKTPMPGYRKINFEIKSDYKTNVFALVEIEDKATSVNIDKVGAEDYDVLLKTPKSGYETIHTTLRKKGTEIVIVVSRNGKQMSTVTVDADIDIDEKNGLLKARWEATANWWAETSLTYNNGVGDFYFKTPTKDWTVHVEDHDDGVTHSRVFNVNIDGNKIDYSSEQVFNEGHITGQSSLETNIKFFEAAKQESKYEIKYDWEMKKPWMIFYESKTNGEVSLLLDLKGEIEMGKKLKASVLIKYPVVTGREDIEGDILIETDGQTSLDLELQYKLFEERVIKIKLRRAGDQASFQADTNIDGFENVFAQSKWIHDSSKFKGDFQLKKNDVKVISAQMGFDMNPFRRFKLAMSVQDSDVQEIEIKWTPNGNEYQLDVQTKGFIESTSRGKVTLETGEETLEWKIQWNSHNKGRQTYAMKIALEHKDSNYGMNFIAERNNKRYKVATDLSIESSSIGKGNARIDLPGLTEAEIKLNFDLASPRKVFRAHMELDGRRYGLNSQTEWSKESSNIVIQAAAGSKKIEFSAKRKGFEKINYVLDIMGEKITFDSTNDFRGESDFIVKAELSIAESLSAGIMQKLELNLDSESVGNSGSSMNGLLKTDDKGYKIVYNHLDSGMEFDFLIEDLQNGKKVKIDYKKKNDNKELVVMVNENFVKLSESLSTNSDLINIKFEENTLNTHLDMSINPVTKEGHLKAGKGSKFVKVSGKANLEGSNFELQLKGSNENNPELLVLNADLVYPLKWNLEAKFKGTNLKVNTVIDDSLTEGKLSFSFVGGQKDINMDSSFVNRDDDKEVDLKLTFGDQVVEVDTKFVPGLFEFEVDSTIPNFEDFDFKLGYGDDYFKGEMEYNDKEIKAFYINNDQILDIEVQAPQNNNLKTTFDRSNNKLDFKSTMGGKEIILAAEYDQTKASVEVTEPFSGLGTIKLEGSWEDNGNGGKVLQAKGDINAIDYRLKAEVDKEKLSIVINRGAQEWRAEGGISDIQDGSEVDIVVTGSSIDTFKLHYRYVLTDKKLVAEMSGTSPPYAQNSEAKIELDMDFPTKMGLKAKAIKDGQIQIDLKTGVSFAEDFSDLRSTFTLFSPPMGVSKELGAEIVYRLVEAADFELKAEFMTLTNMFKAGVKFQRLQNSFESEVSLGYGENEFSLSVGGSKEVKGGKAYYKGHLNNFKLEGNVDGNDVAFELAITGTRFNERGEEDGLTKLIPVPVFKESIEIKLAFDQHRSLKVEVKADDDFHFRALFNFEDQSITGGFIIKALAFDLNKSAEVTLQYGKEGRIEVTVGGLENHKMELDWPTGSSRMTRAIFDSPSYGHYEFVMDEDIKSGIVVLSTGDSIHKVTYEVQEDSDDLWEANVTLESPLFSQGTASFHLTLDPNDNLYLARLSANDEHFFSMSVGWKSNEFVSGLSLISPAVPYDIKASIKAQKSQYILGAWISLSLDDHSHVFESTLMRERITILLASPLLKGHKWTLEGDIHKISEETYQIEARAEIAEESAFFGGNVTLRACNDFSGSLVYQVSSNILAKAAIDFQVQLNQNENLLLLDLTTTNPSIPRFKTMLSMVQAQDKYVGSFVGIAPEMEQLAASFHLPKDNWGKNEADLTMSTLSHFFKSEAKWDLVNDGTVELTIQGPAADTIAFSSKFGSGFAKMKVESTIESLDDKEVKLDWDPQMECSHGWAKAVISDGNGDVEMNILFKFEDKAKVLEASVKTPFEKHEIYEFQLGYEDTSRKMAKAHLATPSGETGATFDYYINSITDFLIQVEVDLPIPELKITLLKLGHTWTKDEHEFVLGAEWKEYNLATEYKLKNEHGSTLMNIFAKYNNASLHINGLGDIAQLKGDFDVKFGSPCMGSNELPISFSLKDQFSINFKVIRNDIPHIIVERDAFTDSLTLEVRDLWVSSAIKIGLTKDDSQQDSQARSCFLEMTWDTANAEKTTEVVSLSWRKSDTVLDFRGGVTWPSMDTDSVSGKVDKTPGQLQVTLSMLHNNQRDWGLDMSIQSEYQEQVRFQRLFPSSFTCLLFLALEFHYSIRACNTKLHVKEG